MSGVHRNKIRMHLAGLLAVICLVPSIAGAFPAGSSGHSGPQKGIDRQEPPPMPFHGPGPALGIWRDQQMIQKLDLTTLQVKQLREADFNFLETQLGLKAELDSLCLRMDRAFTEDKVDRQAVLSLAEKMAEIQGRLFVQETEARLAFETLLNREQLTKLQFHGKPVARPLPGHHPGAGPGSEKPSEN